VGVGKERGGVLAVGAREGQQGFRAHVPAAGKVLEGDDKPTLSALYYDITAAENKFHGNTYSGLLQ